MTHESGRLLLVYVGFCCDKHTAVAVVPAEVWEEDGSFLRYHSECTVVISVRPLRGHALMCVPSCGRCWERCIIVSTTGVHCLSEFFCDFIFFCLPPSAVDHALHCDARSHPQRRGGLCCGCLLRTQRGCLASASMVRFPGCHKSHFPQEHLVGTKYGGLLLRLKIG